MNIIRDIYAATPAGRKASRKRVAQSLAGFNSRTADKPVLRARYGK